MSSFLKRKAKEAADLLKKQTEAKPTEEAAEAPITTTELYDLAPVKEEKVFPQTALDIFTGDGGRTYYGAQIKYDPDTGEAKVVETFTISRQVALAFTQQKTGLYTLKKIRKQT